MAHFFDSQCIGLATVQDDKMIDIHLCYRYTWAGVTKAATLTERRRRHKIPRGNISSLKIPLHRIPPGILYDRYQRETGNIGNEAKVLKVVKEW